MGSSPKDSRPPVSGEELTQRLPKALVNWEERLSTLEDKFEMRG